MADRRVTKTAKAKDGDITALCNPGSTWKRVPKAKAIHQIEDEDHTYYVQWTSKERTEVHVAGSDTKRYLRTDRDSTRRNNLEDLLDC